MGECEIRNEELEVGWRHKIRFVAVRGLYMIFRGWLDGHIKYL